MARKYIKPPWMQRHVGNRLAPLFRSSLISKLSVPGRRSGRWHTVPVAVLSHNGERYLVSYRGEGDWARNLRAAKNGRLIEHGQLTEISVVEVPASERAPLIDTYIASFGKMPTVAATFRALPDPAEHPTFRIITPSQSPPATRSQA